MSDFPLAAVQTWVREQRWAPADASLELVTRIPISVESGLWLVFLRAGQAILQVPLRIFPQGGNSAFTDASAHPLVVAQLLVWAGLTPPNDLSVEPLAAEQSNTSVRLHSSNWQTPQILKFFRVLYPGEHPEVRICEALSRVDSPVVPLFHGYVKREVAGSDYTLAVISEFLSGAVDAWEFFTQEVREPGVLGKTLGQATAQLHRDLQTALPVTTHLSSGELAERVRKELAATPVPAALRARLETQVTRYQDTYHSVFPCQLIHGDYHLGQVLYSSTSPDSWKIIDFEGEPLRPLAKRNTPDLPLRDCAGMLRSFAYAAAVKYGKAGKVWEEYAQKAFLAGYFPDGCDAVTRATLEMLVLEKTCYEYRYETCFRPEWQWIPLSGLETAFNP